MPGTISKGTPAARRAPVSSAHRPKIDGSPPFKRTTVRPAHASATIRSVISSGESDRPVPFRPNGTSAAPGRACSRAAALTR
jgi:hypothetical protein